MIFAAFGTCEPFPRLLNRLDELASMIKEEIVVQTGKTLPGSSPCKTFAYAESLDQYIADARLVISHGGLGLPLEVIKLGKPLIAVPRLARYGEHFNDHQVENCEMLNLKYGIKYILDVAELTPELLNTYHFVASYSYEPLEMFRKNILQVLRN